MFFPFSIKYSKAINTKYGSDYDHVVLHHLKEFVLNKKVDEVVIER